MPTEKPGGSITDRIAAISELTEMLACPDAEWQVSELLAEHAGTAAGEELTEMMVDQWSQGHHLESLNALREMCEDEGVDEGVDEWLLALRLLAERGLVVSVTANDGVVAVTPPTPNMRAPAEVHWVCPFCRSCDPVWLETTHDGMPVQACSACCAIDTAGTRLTPPEPPPTGQQSLNLGPRPSPATGQANN